MIINFIGKEKLLLLLLIIMLINPYSYGYRVAILLSVVLFLKMVQTVQLLDRNVLYLLLFGGIYQLFSASRIDAATVSIISILPDVFLPAILYLAGKGVSARYRSADIRIFFLFFIMLFFSIVPIISILEHIQTEGFEGGRDLSLFWDKNAVISATGLGSYFSINMAAIALLNAPKTNSFHKRITFPIIFLFVLSVICVLRLGNRTQLVIAGAAIILSYFLNFRKMSHLSRILQFLIFGGIIGYVIYLFSSQSELIYFYEDRLNSSESGFAEAGGRSERWQLALESVITDPWGWELSRFGFAHNLWLDVARVSGILAVLPLLLFSVSSLKMFVKSLRRTTNQQFLSTFIFVFFISIMLMFFVEPIIEGMYLLFLVFCLFIGFLSGIIIQLDRRELKQEKK